ncbi:DUF4387 family protein [Xinfangfangia pollutisoli]|uniref:DUF4387 family protein n=1 Tax=Xinfangfangia pollutisoli TaxID=2865960 RepID=UPI001CD73903|nr:DUF4387 family protein [Xinfangfangia pollutisoli]
MRVGEIAKKVRSKNAGPFWVTVDIFCGSAQAYDRLVKGLSTAAVAQVYSQPEQLLKRFDIADLNVIKVSFPRPVVQGSRDDRDMHGAQWAHLLAELEIDG